MEKYSKKHFENIKTIIQNKTGIKLTESQISHSTLQMDADTSLYPIPKRNKKPITRYKYKIRQMAFLTGCLLCFVLLAAFSYIKFSDLNGDRVSFATIYQGDGRFEIIVINSSDRDLKLQDKVKLMQWSTSEEVEGDKEKISIENRTIAAHSQGTVTIDISEGYDVNSMEEGLQENDWYYFVLTNNNFAFGQDWMCSFDFKQENTEEVMHRLVERTKENEDKAPEPYYAEGNLVYSNWCWPTVSQNLSAIYGEQENGAYSDHINIAGIAGDDIYAVDEGLVTAVTFDAAYGNVITVDLEEGISVKYGHLKEIKVQEGDPVTQGQVIGSLGQTGMAAGPNLSFAVFVDGKAVNPLTMP